MMRKVLIGVVALVAIATAITFLRPKVTRAELAITPAEASRCEAPLLPIYQRPGYDRRVAANDYLEYAVATMNVYPDGNPKGFALDKHTADWKLVETIDPKGGLYAHVYHREVAGQLRVLTVFRGTDSLDAADWAANLSWALAWLPIRTQYDQARDAFKEIRRKAFTAAGSRRVGFITAGHSLGGGLAHHVALAFPCTSAAIFNASFVTNRFRLSEPYDKAQVIHVFEDLDEVTRWRRLFFVDRETESYKHYRQDAVNDRVEFQHSMTGLAVGMARQVLRCQEKRADCPVAATDLRARRLYCSSWGKTAALCKQG